MSSVFNSLTHFLGKNEIENYDSKVIFCPTTFYIICNHIICNVFLVVGYVTVLQFPFKSSHLGRWKCHSSGVPYCSYKALVWFPSFWSVNTEVLIVILQEKLFLIFKILTFTVDSSPSASSKNDGETSILWSMRETALSSFCKAVGMWEKYDIQKKA